MNAWWGSRYVRSASFLSLPSRHRHVSVCPTFWCKDAQILKPRSLFLLETNSCSSLDVTQPKLCQKQLLSVLESPAMPLPHLLTFQFLLQHFSKVAEQAESNGLSPRTLSEIFGVLLLRLPAAARWVAPNPSLPWGKDAPFYWHSENTAGGWKYV